jgi:Poly(ADP-ribose) polymerase catalytic domain
MLHFWPIIARALTFIARTMALLLLNIKISKTTSPQNTIEREREVPDVVFIRTLPIGRHNKSNNTMQSSSQLEGTKLAKIRSRLEEEKRLKAKLAKQRSLVEARQVEVKKRIDSLEQAKKKVMLAEKMKKKDSRELVTPTSCNVQYMDAAAVGYERIRMCWESMYYVPMVKINLSVSSPEYRNVARYFAKTAANHEILSVSRIQNRKLWSLYDQTRSIVSLRRRNHGNANEEYLWHGCKLPDGVDKIAAAGFDSSLSQSSTIRGIWLSTNSRYSTDYCYRHPNGTKQILLVRSALGYIGTFDDDGSSGGINKVDSHHAGGTSRGHVRKDDQVGGGTDNRYVIKRNNQAYPAYVLKFR